MLFEILSGHVMMQFLPLVPAALWLMTVDIARPNERHQECARGKVIRQLTLMLVIKVFKKVFQNS
jgi:hypothetical protein